MSKCETREQFDREVEEWKQRMLADPKVRSSGEFSAWVAPNVDWLTQLVYEQEKKVIETAKAARERMKLYQNSIDNPDDAQRDASATAELTSELVGRRIKSVTINGVGTNWSDKRRDAYGTLHIVFEDGGDLLVSEGGQAGYLDITTFPPKAEPPHDGDAYGGRFLNEV